MQASRVRFALIAATALIAACKDAPKKPAAGASSADRGGQVDPDRAAPERHVGPSAGQLRPPRRTPDGTPDVRPPDEDPGSADPGADPGGRRDDGRGDRPDRPTRQERIAEFDSDGDGELTGEERDAMRKARTDDQLTRMDQDGDGQLSPSELESSKRFRTVDFKAADTDGDGLLSTDELDAVMTQQRGKPGGRGADRPRRFRDRGGRSDAGVP